MCHRAGAQIWVGDGQGDGISLFSSCRQADIGLDAIRKFIGIDVTIGCFGNGQDWCSQVNDQTTRICTLITRHISRSHSDWIGRFR